MVVCAGPAVFAGNRQPGRRALCRTDNAVAAVVMTGRQLGTGESIRAGKTNPRRRRLRGSVGNLTAAAVMSPMPHKAVEVPLPPGIAGSVKGDTGDAE